MSTENDNHVTFSPEQQVRLDQIVKNAQGRAAQETREQLKNTQTQLDSLKTELDAAKTALAEATSKAGKNEATRDVEALHARITELTNARSTVAEQHANTLRHVEEQTKENKKLQGQLFAERKNTLINGVAAKENFVDIDAVLAMTAKNIKWNEAENRWMVVTDEGVEKVNAEYKPMTPGEFFADFAAKKPYMVKSDVKGGAGGNGSQRSSFGSAHGRYEPDQIFGRKSNSRLANDLALKNKPEYARLKALAKAQGLI